MEEQDDLITKAVKAAFRVIVFGVVVVLVAFIWGFVQIVTVVVENWEHRPQVEQQETNG